MRHRLDPIAIGKVPANIERIAVRVTAVMSDGRINTRDVVIETRTGEIQPVAAERRGEVVPLFSQQLASRGALTGEEVQILSAKPWPAGADSPSAGGGHAASLLARPDDQKSDVYAPLHFAAGRCPC